MLLSISNSVKLFQFQNGAIKSAACFRRSIGNPRFQFQNGAIKSERLAVLRLQL